MNGVCAARRGQADGMWGGGGGGGDWRGDGQATYRWQWMVLEDTRVVCFYISFLFIESRFLSKSPEWKMHERTVCRVFLFLVLGVCGPPLSATTTRQYMYFMCMYINFPGCGCLQNGWPRFARCAQLCSVLCAFHSTVQRES